MKRISERSKLIEKLDRMNKIKKMKKRVLTPKQLKAKYEHVIRDLIIIRDGHRCMVSGSYHTCSGRLVADHRPVKRSAGNHCFFDPANLTSICQEANFRVENMPALNAAVCEVVVKREGMEKFNELISRAQRKPFKVTEEYVLATIQQLKLELGIVEE